MESTEYIDPATGPGAPLATPAKTWHVYAGQEPVEEYAVTTNGLGGLTTALAREFVHGSEAAGFPHPVAMIDHTSAGALPPETPEILHFLHDVLGSVVALADTNGAVVERYEYDPYGPTYVTTPDHSTHRLYSTFGNPFLWTGQRYDPTTRLYHFWARSYSPRLGRWLQPDPLGYVDGVSLYEYAASGPMSATDPTGTILETIWDVALTGWDVLKVVKNAAESGYGLAAVVYNDATGDEAGMAHAYDGLVQDATEGAWAGVDLVGDGLSALAPGVPAGGTRVLRYADDAVDAAKAIDKGRDVARTGQAVEEAAKTVGRVWPMHHPFPKYLGGAAEQTLKKIPKSLHERLHAALDKWKDGKYARSNGADHFKDIDRDTVINDLREFYETAEGGIFKKYLPAFEQAVRDSGVCK